MRLDSRTAVYCHEFLHKKYAPNSFPGLTPDEPNEVVEEFKKQGFAHEDKVVKALTDSVSGLIVIDKSLQSTEIQRETAKRMALLVGSQPDLTDTPRRAPQLA